MVEAVGLQIFRDIGVDQPDLAVLGIGVGFRDRGLAAAQRLDLGARQRNPGLDRIIDGIVETGLAVFRNHLDGSLFLLCHLESWSNPSSEGRGFRSGARLPRRVWAAD